MEQNEYVFLAIDQFLETWQTLAKRLLENPDALLNAQFAYWQDCVKPTDDAPTDKRFQFEEWHQHTVYNFIKNSYLLLSHHIEQLIQNIARPDDKISQKIKFFMRQYLDAMSPSNFVFTNPEVILNTLHSNGQNLLTGFQQFIEDLKRNNGKLNISQTDLNYFKIGKNIACTAGKVIYENEIMQLICYTPVTSEINAHPLLIIPPWVNKYYILDLQPENSLVNWLVHQGFVVFMISWVNPTSSHRHKNFEDYLQEGPLSALSIIKKTMGNYPVNVVGYCIGGTLLGCMLSILSKKKKSNIASATFLTTLFDYSDPGELGVFMSEEQINQLESNMAVHGYLDGHVMMAIFSSLRANDLIWQAFVNHYLKGTKPQPFDLLFWNADPTNIPANVHSFYLRNMYLHNALIQPKKIKLLNHLMDLTKINVPTYFLAAHDDHIIPWQSSYRSMRYLNTDKKFILTKSGHVAGVINPPDKHKYGYWDNIHLPENAEQFLMTATFHEGSWWSNWLSWLKQYSGHKISAHTLINKKVTPIEDAPGRYVRVSLHL